MEQKHNKSHQTKTTSSFIVPKMFASNIRTQLTKHISTSNSFKLLSEISENVLKTNHVLPTEINSTVKKKKLIMQIRQTRI